MNIKTNCIIIVLLLISAAGQAQSEHYNLPDLSHNGDSLNGFEEAAAIKSAKHLPAAEFNVMMYRLKRMYINNKYNLKNYNASAVTQPYARAEAAACINEDFEQSPFGQITSVTQINGWSLTSGSNNPAINVNANSCNLISCCPGNPSQSELINASSGYIDPYIGTQYSIYSVFGQGSPNPLAAAANTQITQSMSGSKVIRLNNQTQDYSIEKLSKTILVTSSNALFQFAYISVMEGVHACCEGSAFQVKLTNAGTNSLIACPGLSVSIPTLSDPIDPVLFPGCNANSDTPQYLITYSDAIYVAAPGSTIAPTNGVTVYNRWKLHSLDLTAFIGQNITIDFIASDCAIGGHKGYAYIDAQCGPVTIGVNGNTTLVEGNTVSLGSCEPTATITPPANFVSYQWAGPGGFTSSDRILTTSVSGTYTLTLGQPGQCSVSKIITLNVLLITTSESLLCEGNTAVLTASGANNYIWNTGETTPSIVVSPTNTGVYTVSGILPNGYSCASSFVQTVVGPCAGVSNYTINEKGIMIYPNPNNGEFTLNIKKQVKNAELRIENTFGQVLFTQPVSQGDTKIKTKALSAGIYYYTVTESNKPLAKGKMQIN